jgi:predicted transcriptional regulator
MSTTTIRLPEELKARIDTLAAQAGDSAHAFMVKTLDEATARLERQREFHAEALNRLAHMDRTGEYVEFEDMRRYARALAAGQANPPLPAVRKKPVMSARSKKVE